MDSALPPRIVGRYALFDVIASGGMAAVHLGRLMGPVGFSRTVAIKRLHENCARDPEFVAMFLDEARLVARIRHPNVVPTLDVVTLDQELLLVMEYIAGVPLSLLTKRCKDNGKQVPVPIAADILVNVLHGLHAAHEAANEEGQPLNIVHRDVSPQNILVGADGIARVLDFGVAKAVGRMHQTRDGQIKGKLRYMPPEYLLGRSVGRVADIYSASVVLWETLTGRRLFDGGDDAQVMYQVLESSISPPSRWRPEVSAALDKVVLRGLCKDPTGRFQTGTEFAAALEAVLPPVRRQKVSEWVAETAGDSIVQLKKTVARVESSATPRRRPSTPPPKALREALDDRGSDSGSTLRNASAVSRSSATPKQRFGSSRTGRVATVALLMVAVLLGTIWLLFGGVPSRTSAPQIAKAGALETWRTSEVAQLRDALLAWRSELGSVIVAGEGIMSAGRPSRGTSQQVRRLGRRPRAASKKDNKPERIYSRD